MPKAPQFWLADALELFLLDRDAQNLAKKSLATYRYRLSKFITWCQAQGLDRIGDLTSLHIRTYQAELVRRVVDVSAKNHMVDIKTFFKFCAEENLIAESPAARVKLPRVVERIPEILTEDETRRFYRACETERDKALFLVMLDTGARAEEMSNMDRADVNIDEGTILIREGKPRRDRATYISPKTRKELLRYIRVERIDRGPLWRSTRDDGRLTEDALRQAIERIAIRADVKCTPHKIRKTVITTMLRSGVDVFTLRKLSGHKSLDALKPYIAIANVDAEQAHRQNSPVSTLLK